MSADFDDRAPVAAAAHTPPPAVAGGTVLLRTPRLATVGTFVLAAAVGGLVFWGGIRVSHGRLDDGPSNGTPGAVGMNLLTPLLCMGAYLPLARALPRSGSQLLGWGFVFGIWWLEFVSLYLISLLEGHSGIKLPELLGLTVASPFLAVVNSLYNDFTPGLFLATLGVLFVSHFNARPVAARSDANGWSRT